MMNADATKGKTIGTLASSSCLSMSSSVDCADMSAVSRKSPCNIVGVFRKDNVTVARVVVLVLLDAILT